MKKLTRFFLLLSVLALLLTSFATAFAAPEEPSPKTQLDRDVNGLIVVRTSDSVSGEKVPYGSIALYHVADIGISANGLWEYQYTEKFSGCTADFADIGTSTFTTAITNFIAANDVKPNGKSTSSTSSMFYVDHLKSGEKLPFGVYYLAQTEAAPKYDPFKPFVITVPVRDPGSGLYVYEEDPVIENHTFMGKWYLVDAKPKGGSSTITPTPTPTPKPTPTRRPYYPPYYPYNPGPRLPQTGQLWWPVYALAACGVVMFSFGWFRRKHYDE